MKRGICSIIILVFILFFSSSSTYAESNSIPDLNQTYRYTTFGDDLIKKAEEGNPKYQYDLGSDYYLGSGVEQNYKEAAKWFCKSAGQGDVNAQSQLGEMYYKGKGVAKDYKEAMVWYRRAAEQNDAYSQVSLGLMYDKGEGVAGDKNEAIKWYKKAAQQETEFAAFAQFDLGTIYLGGGNVAQDYNEAVKWYRKAAERGHVLAQNNLGIMYYKGEGVERDFKEAVKWYRRAAENDFAEAQNALGSMYYNGEGVEKDYKEAFKWFRRAAEQGDALAQSNIGLAYYQGNGVIEDYVEAYKWTLLAGKNGQDVSRMKNVLQNLMTPGQISIAQQKAKEFVESRKKNTVEKSKESSDRKTFGTGFFITKDGYMLTASHAVRGCSSISIYYQGNVLTGRKILDDSSLDVALLKIDDVNCGWIVISSSSGIKSGDEVFTVGYPQIQLQGLGAKYTNGTINSLTGIADDAKYFQISVPVQPGNSGSPLVDSQGRVVGIIVSRLDDIQTLRITGALPQNVNYALKSSFVLPLLESVPQIASKMKEDPIKVEKDKAIENTKSAVALVICSE